MRVALLAALLAGLAAPARADVPPPIHPLPLADSVILDPTPLTPGEERAMAEEVVAGLTEAWNHGDGEAWASEYWADAEFINIMGSVLSGFDQIAARHQALFDGAFKGSRIRMKVRRVRSLGAAAILFDTDVELTGWKALPPGVKARPDGVLFTRMKHVLLNREGWWRLVASQNTDVKGPPTGSGRLGGIHMADEFTDQHWDTLRAEHTSGGAVGVASLINRTPDIERRRKLWSFAQRSFMSKDWTGKSLDEVTAIVTAGIDESQRQAVAATSPDERYKAVEHANILSFNLSAELADCWPDSGRGQETRERRHFETGLRLAEDCVRARRELGKPPERRALAYWAVGMHQLSLGNRWEALGAFETAAGLAALEVAGTDKAGVKPGGDFAVILYEGYAGIARMALGDAAGRARYDRAIKAFEDTVAKFTGELKEDAQFGIDQLRVVEKRYAAGSAPGSK
jgi:uncharacterized protein (TIGR02246 family)